MTTTKTNTGIAAAFAFALALVGCGGSSGTGGGDAGAGDAGRGDGFPAQDGLGQGAGPNDGGDPDPAPEPAGGTLVGAWYALSQDGVDLPPDTLVFTYRADGTGVVVEEGSSTKDYTWVYDPGAGTLHMLTQNEDLLFDAMFEGDTLSLTHEDPPMALVMRRASDEPDE